MSSVAHADAVLAALTGAGVSAYEPSKAPKTGGSSYAVVRGDLGRSENYRLAGRTKIKAYRTLVLVVGSTEHNARVVADKTDTALRGKRLTVAGSLCTPCKFESSVPVDIDDPDVPGVYSGTLVYTFVSTPTA